MNEDNNHKSSIDWEDWLSQPSGIYLRNWEQALLDKLTADIFGFNALQIGFPQMDCLAASRMPNKWWANDVLLAEASTKIALLHDFNDLPFDTHSLDLVLLPHVLEFAENPHQILREVERVLIPEGKLIICGLNKASLWGVRQMAERLAGGNFLPRSGEFLSFLRLKDWLNLLNMEVGRGHFGCYAPPVNNQVWLQRFPFFERVGQRWWPFFGAVYVIEAVKRVKGMRLVGPAWNNKRLGIPNAVPVTNRHQRNDRITS
ncbi:MAG: methyltransferase type 11 [Solimicrobium sp.]|nr:methyltransferase type 11 [Solimicrobium sp.]